MNIASSLKKPLRRVKKLLRYGKLIDYLKGDRRFLLSSASIENLFPGINDSSLQLPASQVLSGDSMVLSLAGQLTLAAVCRRLSPNKIFEMGTYRGTSTLIMAMNISAQAKIFTLDIAPEARATHQHGTGVGGFSDYMAGDFFLKTPFAPKITQLFGDSRTFNFSSYYGTVDLVFVDADHTYKFVKSDSEHAFKLIRPGGVIIWDDYIWMADHAECSGVADYLHQKLSEKKIYRIQGTRLAVYIDAGKNT
ncbi:MAG: class I SAM-dependent methyltransferase [Candidatus Omnitrophota bacterium]